MIEFPCSTKRRYWTAITCKEVFMPGGMNWIGSKYSFKHMLKRAVSDQSDDENAALCATNFVAMCVCTIEFQTRIDASSLNWNLDMDKYEVLIPYLPRSAYMSAVATLNKVESVTLTAGSWP